MVSVSHVCVNTLAHFSIERLYLGR
jgi:hypothetical protein